MEDQAGEFVEGFRVDERAHFGLLLALPLPVAAAMAASGGSPSSSWTDDSGMGSRVRVQNAPPYLRGAFLPLRRALRCRAVFDSILGGKRDLYD
jgi:hypothetical protein